MPWNWELAGWPKFSYHPDCVSALEEQFLQGAGGAFAIFRHLDEATRKQFIIEILSSEGQKSAEIEGEFLQRDSLQSSIKRHLGLQDNRRIPLKEKGMGELMCAMYGTFEEPLSHEMVQEWYQMLFQHPGGYREHPEPMQIVSGRMGRDRVFFEAPPSAQVHQEMTQFIDWFNRCEESVLIRASIAHVYFESIHPFEDGNGRIGRVIVEKALSQSLGQSTLLALSQLIMERRRDYYYHLGLCNHTLQVEEWICFFSKLIVEAQENSMQLIEFLISKSKMMMQLSERLNERQEKVLLRMFEEGPSGFQGGLSAENYMAITKTSRATATRDLTDLVEKKALTKMGKLKHTRYYLNI